MDPHGDPVDREALIRDYLVRRASPATADVFEAHYLGCDECYAELRASDLLIAALDAPLVHRRHVGDVVIVQFGAAAQLTAGSREYSELLSNVERSGDQRVLVDLDQVSRVDSAGLALLMRYYAHLVAQGGRLGVLNPSDNVRKVFEVTRANTLLDMYTDEAQAVAKMRSR